jgi:hypothetical protein
MPKDLAIFLKEAEMTIAMLITFHMVALSRIASTKAGYVFYYAVEVVAVIVRHLEKPIHPLLAKV